MSDAFVFAPTEAQPPLVQLLRRGPVAEVTLQRPAALNALNAQMLAQLHQIAAELDDGVTRCVLLRGAGQRAFAAGADVAAMAGLSASAAAALSQAGQACMAAWAALPMPTVAVVQGFALGGGCELALCCDVILAASAARFGMPEVGLGLVPGFGGTHRLAARVGLGTALAWVLGGEHVDAAEAHRVGLVQAVYSADGLEAGVSQWAQRFLQRSPAAQAAAKALVRAAAATDSGADGREAAAFGRLLAGEQGQQGIAAFIERRRPSFAKEIL